MNLEERQKVKIGCLIAGFAVLLYLGIQHLDVVVQSARFLLGLASPFIIGVCVAFVLNFLMRLFEEKIFQRLNRKKNPRWEKFRRPVCIVLTFLLFLGLLALLFSFLIPQLTESVKTLGKNMPAYMVNLESWANQFLNRFGISADIVETVSGLLYQFSDSILNYLTSTMPKIFQTASSIASGVFNVIFGFIISIYMLAGKEKLMRNLKRTGYAFLPRRAADYLCHVYHIANERFTGFVSGQLTEAVILGVLCYVGMMVIGIFLPGWQEYAILISVIIGLTNIVPIIGPILGTVPGVLIMLMVNPRQALIFVLYVVVLQQLESNLIYPRVVGSSVGLPGIWVMFAVLVGGDLFGLPGVLLGVPTVSVLYVLLRESVSHRLKERQLKV